MYGTSKPEHLSTVNIFIGALFHFLFNAALYRKFSQNGFVGGGLMIAQVFIQRALNTVRCA